MNHIIVDFQPFLAQQNIMVYIDGVCEKQIQVEIDRIVDAVNGLRKQYNINQIDLCGNQNYLTNFRTKMNNKFEDNCEINIIKK